MFCVNRCVIVMGRIRLQPGTTLSHSAPDLFTVSASLTADRQTGNSGNVDAGSGHWFTHAPCELCTDCADADRIAALTQLRPLMDTPV